MSSAFSVLKPDSKHLAMSSSPFPNYPPVMPSPIGKAPETQQSSEPEANSAKPLTVLVDQEHDETQASISCQDLLYLMRHRFLDILIVDLQVDVSERQVEHQSSLTKKRLPGAYVLHSLAVQILQAPNSGSVVYSIVCHEGLRKLLSKLNCPFLICYDEQGLSDGISAQFVLMMRQVERVTGKQRFGGLQWARYLRGGLRRFSELFPLLCQAHALPTLPIDSINQISFTKPHSDAEEEKLEQKRLDQCEIQHRPPATHAEADRILHQPASTTQLTAPLYPQNTAESAPQVILNVDDPPSPVLSNLFVGGLQSTTRRHILDKKIDCIISIGEIPRILEPVDSQWIQMESHPLDKPHKSINCSLSTIRILDSNNPSGEQQTLPVIHQLDHYTFALEDASHAPIQYLLPVTTALLKTKLDDRPKSDRPLNVLVHCFGGVSRSVTVILGYLIAVRGDSLAEAFARVFTVRPWVRPNDGFWKRLQQLEIDERVVRLVRKEHARHQSKKSADQQLLDSLKTEAASINSVLVSNTTALSSSLNNLALTDDIKPSTSATTTINRRRSTHLRPHQTHHRSRTLTLLEDEAAQSAEGSLTAKVMRSTRLDRVREWQWVRDQIQHGSYQ